MSALGRSKMFIGRSSSERVPDSWHNILGIGYEKTINAMEAAFLILKNKGTVKTMEHNVLSQ